MIKQYSAKTTEFTQADYARQYSLLECAIREKIDRKKRKQQKLQSLAGYILLYQAIADLYNKNQFEISFNEHGKPMCDFCFFNISHSGKQVVCVVSDEPVGVDIQKIKDIVPREKYKFFNNKENDYVNCEPELVSKRYIEVFTKKESALKMMGETIASASFIDTFSNEFSFKCLEKDGFFSSVCIKNVFTL